MKKITLFLLMVIAMSLTWQSHAQSIIIGTGTAQSGNTDSDPIDGYFNSFRYQVVYTAAELSASLTPYDEITALGWSISEDYAGGDLLGYTIKMGHTSATNSASHDASSTIVVKNAFNYNPTVTVAGVFDMINFDTNFVWNGIDNVLVEVCSDGQNSFTSPYGQVRTTTVANGSRRYRTDGGTSCSVNTNNVNGNKPNVQFNYIDGTPPTDELDYYNLQWPPTGTITAGESFQVYAQAYEAGLTDVTSGQASGIEAWIGYSVLDTDPSGSGWTWIPATFNTEVGNNDEYMLNLGASTTVPGTFYYASRWSLNGAPYTYGGIQADGSFGGMWGDNNNGSGVLTVNPPVNDDCANAVSLTVDADLSCSNPIAGTTIGALESLTGCLGTANDDVWYSFVATSVAHSITITNTGGNTDIVTQVFDACGGNSLLCQDTPNSPVILGGLSPGNTYYFRIYTYSSTESIRTSFTVCVGTPPTPPANDECANALVLTESADDTCANAVAGSTVNATPFASGACSSAGKDVWYAFTPSQNSSYQFNVTETMDYGSSSTYVTVYSGTCGNLTQIGSSCTTTSLPTRALTSGTTYYVNVRSTSTTAGVDFSLCAYPIATPANDECDNAVALTVNSDFACGIVTAGTTVTATESGQSDDVSGTPNNDVWFSFVATNPAHRVSLTDVVAVVGSATDMGMGVYDGTGGCGSLVFTDTSDPNTLNLTGLTVGVTYYVRVYGWASGTSTAQTNFNICVGTPPPPPANDDFANAIVLNCGQNVTGSTALATLDEDDAPDGFGADMDAPNVWYTYTGTGSAETITINMCPSAYDTSFLVYTGTSGNLTLVGGNDDGGESGCPGAATRSYGQFLSDGTTTYYIAVEGYNPSSTGAYNLTLTCAVACTPAQTNQDCTSATALVIDGSMTLVDNTCATVNAAQPSCDTFGTIADIWYSFVAPPSGEVTIETFLGTATAAHVAVYSGACGALTGVNCSDEGTGGEETVNLTGLTAGNTYYLQLWNNGVEEGTFEVSISDPTLSIGEVVENDQLFTYFPNPVKNELKLKAQSNIQKVSIFSMLGQEVLRTTPNSITSDVDMSALQAGAYFVKVTVNNTTETIRIIKQ